MGSYSGTCEIVEARDDISTVKDARIYPSSSGYSVAEKNQKLPPLKLGYKDNLDDDINKLFETISLRSSSRDLSYLPDGTSPKLKSALKKPMTMGVPRSPRVGISEPVTLKQALRDLCISKASEMAAMKRLSKSGASPRISEAGKIQTLYNSVVTDARRSGPSNVDSSKRSSTEIPPVLEESKSLGLNKESQSLQTSKSVLSQNVQSSEIAVAENETGASLMRSDLECSSSKFGVSSQSLEPIQMEKQMSASSPPCCNTNGSKVELPEKDSSPKKLGNKASTRKGMLQTTSSSSTSINGNRVCKLSRHSPRAVKSIIKNKSLGKKKPKQGSDSGLHVPQSNEANNKSVPATTPLVCERCWCEIENSKGNITPGPADGINLKSVLSGPAPTGCNNSREVAKVKKNGRLKEQLEFSQSSKSSQGDYSSSTSTSDESNVSGSSFGNRPHMSKDFRWQAIRDAQMQHGVLGLRNFNLLKKLGCGDIGTVYLSELIGQNCLFAIKVMDNEFLARRKKMPRAQTEREILRMLDHPFLPTLYAQFTSENLSCLVMEYCPGGDLHVLRQKQLGRCFSEPAARFYVAEVLLALEYLHMLGVVYRDLKPENILVREDGHIMLTDFDLSLRCDVSPTLLKSSSDIDPAKVSGTCAKSSCIEPFCIEPSCQVACFSPRFLPPGAKARKLKADLAAHIRSLPQLVAEPTDARSNSFVGTHEYLAPEIIKGEGHGAAVDWWTFGVFLYELLYGRTPFKGSNNEETLANVVLQNLRFPDSPFVSFQARDLIKGLLVKEPENRLGTEKGAAEIKQHPFFEGLNWALIRCAIPPELPDLCEFELGVSANLSFPFGPSSYLSAQARVVDEYTMSQTILQNMLDGGATGMLIVVTGASHVTYGARGTGVPARISRKLQKKNQVVILLDPERQFIRREGEVPVADFLWYSAARPCSRNCFDRVEIARVMNAAGQRRDALPQDLQKGIDLGLVSPEVLQNFFDLEKYPLLSELTHRFQGFRERLLADPKFLQRLAIEEGISVTTTLLAQYQKRKENFFQELDYVITDTVRGSVVDFFTVWLPAPTLSFLSYADESIAPDNISSLIGLLGSIPDNAFQKNPVGTNWNLNHRIASVVFGGLKLAGVGFISSIGAVASSNSLFAVRKFLNPAIITNKQIARSPILKTAVVYALFLGISANLRYQIIAGVVEHRISDQFASQTFLVNMLSFVSRTINSYWGTQQWIDLARSTGLQVRKTESPEQPTSDSPNQAAILCNSTGLQVTKTESPEPPSSDSPNQAAILCNEAEEASIDEIKSE